MMSKFQFRSSNLKSSGFTIYEATSSSESYFAYFYTGTYDQAFRSQDLEPRSEYLREPLMITNPGSKYIFFKYFGSFRLADISKKLLEAEVINILGQLISAIYNLHKSKLMGRCFNIYNILVTNIQKGSFCIKLMDFGFGCPLEYQPLDGELNCYDYQFDLFLIGRILYFLLTNQDIPEHGSFKSMWPETQKKIETSSYSKTLQELCKNLISPSQQNRYCFANFMTDFLGLKGKQQQFTEIKKFYSEDQETLSSINQEIKKRDDNSQVVDIAPPILLDESLNNLIFFFKPELNSIHKYLNFRLFNFTIIDQAIENVKLKFISSDHISVPLSIFVLEKIKCIFFQKIFLMFESQQFLKFNIKEIENLIKSQQYQACFELLKNLKYLQQQFMPNYLDNLYKSLQIYYPDYQNHLMYQEIKKFISIDNFNLNFDDVKNYYRLPLNNLLKQIENLEENKSNRQFRLLIFMCILINKIGDVSNLNKHYQTIIKSQQLKEINSPLQVNDFLARANIEELDEQFDELRKIYFS
ncbi:unnamed protein product (macronuclear) [Paramecium tetraurelia]|uniref:Protein kinase domain-containing protein n=1 Tax=Paramecium tetraurelia TaxID=5888 RepID=A0D312_PARTE|nr:uncharacterized protein GSPATT00012914001 [Paramecium tetraurelia]CAK77429.1 unnamed protein product [Paramecium tetraurelia]|eukprot:XP_001444826.1 hypothetical protein (macronuclear) [Paramecium tetraurelia strain d4-2]